MYTLLPEQQIKNLQREYYIRLLILFLFCISGAIWIGIGSLLPSYIISVVQEQHAENHLKDIQKTTKTPINMSTAAEVTTANAAIQLVKNGQDTLLFSAVVEDIVNHRIPGIVLSSITVSHAPADGNQNQTSISVRGNAATRDALVAFQRSLVADPALIKVDLPISNLAKGSDIDFTMTMKGIH